MALCKWEGRITVPTGGWSMTVAEDNGARSATVTVAAAGDYYLTSTTSLLTTIKTALDANSTLLGTYTLTLDDDSDTSLGKVTISVSGSASAFAVTTWNSTDLRDVLGFAGTTSNAASATGGYQSKRLLLPNTNRLGTTPEITSTASNFGKAKTDGTYVQAPSGVAYGLYYNTIRYDNWSYQHLAGHKVWKVLESTTNESLERFWEDVLRQFIPFRYHPDRSSDSVYVTVRANQSANEFAPTAEVESWVGTYSRWTYNLDVDAYVT